MNGTESAPHRVATTILEHPDIAADDSVDVQARIGDAHVRIIIVGGHIVRRVDTFLRVRDTLEHVGLQRLERYDAHNGLLRCEGRLHGVETEIVSPLGGDDLAVIDQIGELARTATELVGVDL